MVIYPDKVIVAERFTAFDKDGDGDIEKEEFVEDY
jgi:Ca2+-binding EF-hand superfamily protein